MNTTSAEYIVAADGDREHCARLAGLLRDADCSVIRVHDVSALVDALDAHARTKSRLAALVVNGFLTSGGIVDLYRAGMFDTSVPVIVTLAPRRTDYQRIARAAGAVLTVDRSDLSEVVRAVRHVVDRHRRWDGEWISTGLTERIDARDDARRPSRH